jgi:hypothetical protein
MWRGWAAVWWPHRPSPAFVDAGGLVVYVHQTDDDALVVELHLRDDESRELPHIVLDGTPLPLP